VEALRIVAQTRGVDVSEVECNTATKQSVLQRQSSFLELVREQPHGANVLAVSHGGFVKRFLRNFCGTSAGVGTGGKSKDELCENIANCSINCFSVTFEGTSGAPRVKVAITQPHHINFIHHLQGGEDVVWECAVAAEEEEVCSVDRRRETRENREYIS
jgi:broad specificity phosphatase PhoE